MNVLVMGTGGVGGYFGALLARAGHRVTVVARGSHLDALQKRGLRVETAVEDDFTVPVHALSITEPGLPADLVLVAVKSYDLDEAISLIRPAVGPNTTLLTLLNGVESGEQLAAEFGPDHVLDGVVYIESFIREPGIIAQLGGPRRVVFGNRNGPNGEREGMLLETFEAAGWNVELTQNVPQALWTKFAYLGPFAACNTATGLGSARLCATPESASLLEQMVSEYVAVGNAEGAELPADFIDGVLARYRSSTIGATSMLRDRISGKRIEYEALVGSVLRRGKALDIPTPVTATLYALLKPMADGAARELGAV